MSNTSGDVPLVSASCRRKERKEKAKFLTEELRSIKEQQTKSHSVLLDILKRLESNPIAQMPGNFSTNWAPQMFYDCPAFGGTCFYMPVCNMMVPCMQHVDPRTNLESDEAVHEGVDVSERLSCRNAAQEEPAYATSSSLPLHTSLAQSSLVEEADATDPFLSQDATEKKVDLEDEEYCEDENAWYFSSRSSHSREPALQASAPCVMYSTIETQTEIISAMDAETDPDECYTKWDGVAQAISCTEHASVGEWLPCDIGHCFREADVIKIFDSFMTDSEGVQIEFQPEYLGAVIEVDDGDILVFFPDLFATGMQPSISQQWVVTGNFDKMLVWHSEELERERLALDRDTKQTSECQNEKTATVEGGEGEVHEAQSRAALHKIRGISKKAKQRARRAAKLMSPK